MLVVQADDFGDGQRLRAMRCAIMAGSAGQRTDDLLSESLIISRQAAEQIFPVWFGENADPLHVAATFNLSFNGALFVREGIGVMISLDKLVNTGGHSDLVFRPITGVADAQLKLVWKKNQPLTKAAALLIEAIKEELSL